MSKIYCISDIEFESWVFICGTVGGSLKRTLYFCQRKELMGGVVRQEINIAVRKYWTATF